MRVSLIGDKSLELVPFGGPSTFSSIGAPSDSWGARGYASVVKNNQVVVPLEWRDRKRTRWKLSSLNDESAGFKPPRALQPRPLNLLGNANICVQFD
jgi:hypothetical protein